MGLLIEVLGLHLMDPGMDRRATVFFCGKESVLTFFKCMELVATENLVRLKKFGKFGAEFDERRHFFER